MLEIKINGCEVHTKGGGNEEETITDCVVAVMAVARLASETTGKTVKECILRCASAAIAALDDYRIATLKDENIIMPDIEGLMKGLDDERS